MRLPPLRLDRVEPWSPDSPTLYDLEIKLKSGDSVKSYFGMRKIEVAKDTAGYNRLFLNHHPVFQIGPLDQGWWPDGLYTPPTDEAIKFDIQTLKSLGFNMLRKHVKVEPARYYYWCDKLGLMIWQDMPSAMRGDRGMGVKKGSPDGCCVSGGRCRELQSRAEGSGAQSAEHDQHYCLGAVQRGLGRARHQRILKMVKEMDPSRLVNGPSGWEDRGYGDMKDMHVVSRPRHVSDAAGSRLCAW